MMDRDVEAENGAVAPADDRRLLDLQIIHEGQHVRGHQVIAIGLIVAGAAPMAAAIHHDDAIGLRERGHLQAPIVRIAEAAMEHDHRLALAEGRIPDLDAVDRRVAALRRLGEARCRRQHHPGVVGAGLMARTPQHEQAKSEGDGAHEDPPELCGRRKAAPIQPHAA